MGKTFLFECPQCQYRAKISGGADRGLDCDVQTIVCRDCRELYDVFTRVRRMANETEFPKKFSAFNRPEIPHVILRESLFAEKRRAPRKFEWRKIKLQCPVAPKHFVEEWKNPGRCPRCGNFMEQNGIAFRLWD